MFVTAKYYKINSQKIVKVSQYIVMSDDNIK
jgi:hypothetical protein